MTQVLVIGAAGFIGRHTIKELRRAGKRVRAFDLHAPIENKQLGIDWIVGDIHDSSLVASAVRGCESVIFVAGHSRPATANKDIASDIRTQVEQTVRVAEIAEAGDVSRFVFASSGGTVYGIDSNSPITEDKPKVPRNAYGVSKLAVEHYLRIINELTGLKTVSLRISNPFGEGQYVRGMQGFVAAAMECAVTGEPLSIWGDGSVIRDFVYIGDVARAFVLASNYDGKDTEMNIGSGKGHSLLDVIKVVEAETRKRISLVFRPGRGIDVASNILDIAKAREELGWNPGMDFRDAISRTAKWWKEVALR